MKLLYCEDCRGVAAPDVTCQPVWCFCRRHAIWPLDDKGKIVAICDAKATQRLSDGITPVEQRAFILLIANELLQFPKDAVGESDVQGLIDFPRGDHPFKRTRSLIYRMRPTELIYGERRTVWAPPPKTRKTA